MPKTVGIERTVTKYLARVRVAGDDYKKGVTTPKRSWASAAAEAQPTFQSAVTAGDIGDRWARGVSEAGDTKWSSMAQSKGVERFSRGVELGQTYYRTGMTDVLSTIEGVTFGPKGPAGSPQNYDRVKNIGDALHTMKVGRS